MGQDIFCPGPVQADPFQVLSGGGRGVGRVHPVQAFSRQALSRSKCGGGEYATGEGGSHGQGTQAPSRPPLDNTKPDLVRGGGLVTWSGYPSSLPLPQDQTRPNRENDRGGVLGRGEVGQKLGYLLMVLTHSPFPLLNPDQIRPSQGEGEGARWVTWQWIPQTRSIPGL